MHRFAWLLLLAGCYDFEGEAHRLGFTTDHVVAEGTAWTPDSPILRGSRVRATASERLHPREGDPPLEETGTVSGGLGLVESDGDTLVFDADHAGRVWFDGELRDSFRVREAAPSVALAGVADLDPEASLAIAVGAPCPISISLADATGELIGYKPSDLSIDADGPLGVAFEDGVPVLTASGPGQGTLTVGILAFDVPGPQIRAVADADVVALELAAEALPGDDGKLVVRATGRTADGDAVQCLPVHWTGETEWAGGANAVVLAGAAVGVELGELSAHL